jgi:hypothetical protein
MVSREAALAVFGGPLAACTAFTIRARCLQDRSRSFQQWNDFLLQAEQYLATVKLDLAWRQAIMLKHYSAPFTGSKQVHMRQLWQQLEVLLWSQAVFIGSQLGPAVQDLLKLRAGHQARIAAEILLLNPAIVAAHIATGAAWAMIGWLLAEGLWLESPPVARSRAFTSQFAALD